MDKDRYTASDAAQLAGVSYSTIRNHIREGKLNAQREGRCLWIGAHDLAALYPEFSRSNGSPSGSEGDSVNSVSDDANQSLNSVNSQGEGDAFDTENDANISADGVNVMPDSVNALQVENESLRRERDALRDDLRLSQQHVQDALSSVHGLTEQIDHLTQLLAMKEKNVAALTEQHQFLLEDQRRQSWWKRILGR